MPTTLAQAMSQLEALGDEQVRTQNRRSGAGDDQFGVRLGDIRKVAAKIRKDHALALALWKTRNVDARCLAILVMDPTKLTADELDRMVRAVGTQQVADWLNAYVVRKHADREALRAKWMKDRDPWAARAGWDLTYQRTGGDAAGLDLPALLDRIEREMAGAPPEAQWTMNFCLIGIGTHHPNLRKRAVAIGEALGVYRDYPVSKGCTSPFAPIAIQELARRKG